LMAGLSFHSIRKSPIILAELAEMLRVSPVKGLLGIYDRYTSKLKPNGQNAVIHLFRRIMY
jgi:hypothetical protein